MDEKKDEPPPMPLHPGLKGKGGKGGKTMGKGGMGKSKQGHAPAAHPAAEEVEHLPVPRTATGVRKLKKKCDLLRSSVPWLHVWKRVCTM